MTQVERGSLAEVEGSPDYNLGVLQNELRFVIHRVRHFMRLTEDVLVEAERVAAECEARLHPTPTPDEQEEEARAHADDAACDQRIERWNDAQEMLAEMRTDDDGPLAVPGLPEMDRETAAMAEMAQDAPEEVSRG